ncbi:MAG: GAF domain-containing protein, partial [Gemmatimonadales bacterium]
MKPGGLVAITLVLFWLSIGLVATGHRDPGLAAAAASSFVALLILRRVRDFALRQKDSLEQALAASARRNRELDRLRDLSSALLSGNDLATLNRQVAQVAAELLDAEGGAIMLMVEEGRFVRVVAGSGPLMAAVGALVPVDKSLVGHVILTDDAVLVDDMEGDSRNHPLEQLTGRLRGAAMVPMRSAGLVVGAVCAYNRNDGRPFT